MSGLECEKEGRPLEVSAELGPSREGEGETQEEEYSEEELELFLFFFFFFFFFVSAVDGGWGMKPSMGFSVAQTEFLDARRRMALAARTAAASGVCIPAMGDPGTCGTGTGFMPAMGLPPPTSSFARRSDATGKTQKTSIRDFKGFFFF